MDEKMNLDYVDINEYRGSRLKERREDAGLTRDMVSKMTGIPINTLYRYENGLREPTLSNAIKVENAIRSALKFTKKWHN